MGGWGFRLGPSKLVLYREGECEAVHRGKRLFGDGCLIKKMQKSELSTATGFTRCLVAIDGLAEQFVLVDDPHFCASEWRIKLRIILAGGKRIGLTPDYGSAGNLAVSGVTETATAS